MVVLLGLLSCGKKEASTEVKPADTKPTESMSPEYQKISAECDQGNGEACTKLAHAIMKGRAGAPTDKALARALFTKACEQSRLALTCVDLSVHYKRGDFPDVGANPESATKYESIACDLGDKDSCVGVAFAYLQGTGVAADKDKARAMFDSACDKDTQAACYQLMKSLGDGTFSAKGDRDLAYYRKRSCTLGVPDACDAK